MNKILLARYRALVAKAFQYILVNGLALARTYTVAGGRVRPAIHAAGEGGYIDDLAIANARVVPVDTAIMHMVDALSMNANGELQEPEDVIMRSATILRHIASGITYGIVWGRGSSVTTYMYKADARIAGVVHGRGNSITTDLNHAAGKTADIEYGAGSTKAEDINVAGVRTAEAIKAYGQIIATLLSKANPDVEDLQDILMAVICYTASVANITSLTPEDLLMTTTFGELIMSASPNTQEPENILAQSIMHSIATAGAVLVDHRISVSGLLSAYYIANASWRAADAINAAGASTSIMTSQAGIYINDRVLLFEEQTLSLTYITYDLYVYSLENVTWSIQEGAEYIVVWDGVEYKRVATLRDSFVIPLVGNPSIILGSSENSGEHFLLGTQDNTFVVYADGTYGSHTLALYQLL